MLAGRPLAAAFLDAAGLPDLSLADGASAHTLTGNFTLAHAGTDYSPAGGKPALFDDRVFLSAGKTF